jgi:hypothetical protein
MFRPTRLADHRRRGNILIVTMLLLALFAVVALTVVYYTRAAAEQARILGEAQANGDGQFPDDGMGAFNVFVNTLVYGAPPSGQGLINAARGHDLMSTMYGGNGGVAGAIVPWNGVGTFSDTTALGIDRRLLVNFRMFPGMTTVYDPEFTNPGGVGRDPTTVLAPSGTYIPKNPAYTYPDVKDFYLAALCPATGEVLVPSFHRPGVFGSLDPTNGGAANNNWTNAVGMYLTPRPRPKEHAGFPAVPPNADGTYTGDLQNLPGGVGVQKNDSIWIDIGLPPITLPNGKRVKPLVAALILDLNGSLNLSIHGNQLNAGVHTSGAGIGPWEVSLEKALPLFSPSATMPDGRAIVAARGLAQARFGGTTRSFAPRYPIGPPAMQLPAYSAVPWTAAGGSAPGSLNLPGSGGPLFASAPAYSSPGYDSTNALVANHPALFNPNEWPWPTAGGGANTRAYSLGDAKLLRSKYAAPPYFYLPMDAGISAPTSLRGSATLPNPYPPRSNDPNSYRLDPAHANRMIFTPYAYGLDRPGLAPGANQVQNSYAALGALDLNRPLADYRDLNAAINVPTPQPLGPGNMGNEVAARMDRQRFAMDIFVRLIVATGQTGATVLPNGTVMITSPFPPETPEYTALRRLAQLAANIVDYIDADDISTPFVWNPLDPTDPQNVANFAAAELPYRVVFGVEKPRLVINEAYAEVTNDPADPKSGGAPPGTAPQGPAHVRFWVELLNPTQPPSTSGTTTPTGNGAVALYYPTQTFSPYRLEIARANRTSTPNAADKGNLVAALSDPMNVTGAFGKNPDIAFQFKTATDLTGNPAKQVVGTNWNAGTIPYNPNFNPAQGIAVLGPPVTRDPLKPDEFAPDTTVAPWSNMIVSLQPPGGSGNPNGGGTNQDSMAYTITLPTIPPAPTTAEFRRHVVLLRRLANPYLAPNDPSIGGFNAALPPNPFITVDYMDYVPAFDSVYRGKDDRGLGRDPRPATNGFDPLGERFSVGKVEPYASLSLANLGAAPAYPTYTFPTSMVLSQAPVPAVANSPKHTFGRHNGTTATGPAAATFTPPATLTDTLMAPFDWLVHMDRPLINQLELLHVSTGKPHELTQQFMIANAGAVQKFTGSLQTAMFATTPPWPQLYQALDLLRIQPYGQGRALGGRGPGPININTIQDKRVWDALFDANGSNGFTQTDVNNLWNALMASRTLNMSSRFGADGTTSYPCPVPGATVYDTNSTTGDRPFLPFGAATITGGVGGGSTFGTATAFRGGTGLQLDTLLRGNPGPWLNVGTGTHPYQQTEAARKILNNVTTVSHTFAVWVTVGYFEVANETPSGVPGVPNFVTLGKEYYKEVPGDLRQKFFAVVDRSNVGLDAAGYATGSYTHATTRPLFTTLEGNVAASGTQIQVATAGPTADVVVADGTMYSLLANASNGSLPNTRLLVIGVGSTMEVVTINPATATYNAATGITTYNLAAGTALQWPHGAGESVSNVIPGNPGPQLGFDVNLPKYQPVVPHWSRVP